MQSILVTLLVQNKYISQKKKKKKKNIYGQKDFQIGIDVITKDFVKHWNSMQKMTMKTLQSIFKVKQKKKLKNIQQYSMKKQILYQIMKELRKTQKKLKKTYNLKQWLQKLLKLK